MQATAKHSSKVMSYNLDTYTNKYEKIYELNTKIKMGAIYKSCLLKISCNNNNT